MQSQEIEEFAKLLVNEVRDAAIQACDSTLNPKASHAIAKRWKKAGSDGDLDTIAKTLIPDIVDKTICQLLRAIDQGALQISFSSGNGKEIKLPADGMGELCGWYIGHDGWRAKYSRERRIDDFSDLRLGSPEQP